MTVEPWQARAACRDHWPDLFFPTEADDATREQAVAICQTCPVRSACAEEARRLDIKYGVWGGIDREETRQRGRPPKPCGSEAAYHRHLRNVETPCEECRNAYLEANRARNQRRSKAKVWIPA